MDQQFLQYYNEELEHLRSISGEFARDFPKIAGRLGLDSFECADPYVERLLEGFSFLAARVRLKLDDGFPRMAEAILQTVFPQALAPIPAMTIAQLQPDYTAANLIGGVTIPKGTVLRTAMFEEIKTACEFRTAHDVTLWPLSLLEAKYLTRDLEQVVPIQDGITAGLSLKFKVQGDATVGGLPLDRLPVFIRATGDLGFGLLEQLGSVCTGVTVKAGKDMKHLPASAIQFPALHPENGMLPGIKRRFRGFQLLTEYFSFPQRFLFFEIYGLQEVLPDLEGKELEIVLKLRQRRDDYANRISTENFSLYCTPAVNLFPKRVDRINYDLGKREFHVVKDRTKPLDFEIHSVESGEAYDSDNRELFKIYNFYYSSDRFPFEEANYFSIYRRPRLMPQNRVGRSSYVGSEAFLTFSGPDFRQDAEQINQIGLNTLCTNRDLPLLVPLGKGSNDFAVNGDYPIAATKCIIQPSRPCPPPHAHDVAWQSVSHLRLNYLSLCHTRDGNPREALQSILRLYSRQQDEANHHQIDGIQSIDSQTITRRLSGMGPVSFIRGMEITITCDEQAFAGMGCYVLGEVLHQFFSQYVTLNSFVETVLRTNQRGEVHRWKPLVGSQQLL